MATADMGLFGPTPYEIQQAQQQALQSQAANYANQSPLQRAAQGMFTAGGQVGNMAAGAMGWKNPQVALAEQTQNATQGVDMSTSEGLMEGAKRLANVNPTLAAKWVQAAREAKKSESEIDLRKAQATKALAYRPAGQGRDPETVILLDKMTQLESQGLEDTPEYKALAGRVQFLQTQKSSGIMGAGTIKRMATNIGEVIFDPAAKKYTYADGTDIESDKLRSMIPLGNDASNAALVAQAKAGASTVGKGAGSAQVSLPDALSGAKMANYYLDQLENHPGFQEAIGMGLYKAKELTGGKAKDFTNLLNQVNAGAFMSGAQMLRGLGQMTEVEGRKATEAVARMSDPNVSEVEFRNAIRDYRLAMKEGIRKIEEKANMSYKMPAAAASSTQPAQIPQTTPVAPSKPFSFTTPAQVKAAMSNGLSREDARAILLDMQSRGIEIK